MSPCDWALPAWALPSIRCVRDLVIGIMQTKEKSGLEHKNSQYILLISQVKQTFCPFALPLRQRIVKRRRDVITFHTICLLALIGWARVGAFMFLFTCDGSPSHCLRGQTVFMSSPGLLPVNNHGFVDAIFSRIFHGFVVFRSTARHHLQQFHQHA